ncbi:tRNA 2-thiouridine(34) synthase MnmA [Candidatus Gracilibacteria bacterium]|nr:tRNA 2-thiouridine(34) synthase MnmA [Candidatus Gracilibacteria bacterium]MCF7819080.1 tRNA 2-thiouridine(34) synthase MnmA [Candidatus Gracilibacteria bacterium]
MARKKIVVGLSGGVDSSVTAKLLIDQGHEVVGIFMKNWEDDSPECTAPQDCTTAEKIAQKLKIPFYTVNFSREYWENVFEYFLEENRQGRTPNPDILCNRHIKFGAFLREAEKLGADLIATGHYAKKYMNPKTKKYELHIPVDREKDQTYFLHAITQSQLAKALFPLQDLQKSEVRRIARENNFSTADKKDSTGICFIGERNYMQFLQRYIRKDPGDFVDIDTGKKVGEHIGLSFYTIGQRKNLQIGGVKGFEEKPWFVIEKDAKNNQILVSQNEEKLLGKELTAHKLTWIGGNAPSENFECEARIRYRSKKAKCYVKIERRDAINRVSSQDSMTHITFDSPVRAISPGQSIVFYDGDVCLGGGEIV